MRHILAGRPILRAGVFAVLASLAGGCSSKPDAAKDAAPLDAPSVALEGGGSGDTTPGACEIQCADCVCAAICDNKSHALDCLLPNECDCFIDGKSIKTVALACGSVQAMVTAYKTVCGFPGREPKQLDGSVLRRDGPIVPPGYEKDLGGRRDR
ncbi:MAG: hypothetical protein IT371_15625 [Deltaproteobacteria bacterium]|nr:hypothetical protein [Deltaproteobacteria bacterium]